MPFNPTIPQPNTLADADAMRDQLNALHDENTALAATVAALDGRVAALEALVLNFVTNADLASAIATRAPKPTGLSPLPYGASPTYEQTEVQGGFDLLANLITTLNA